MVPEGWSYTELRQLTSIYDGTHSTPDYVEKGVPFYSVEHLTSGDFSKTKFISNEVYERENKRVRLEKGDILMTRIGDIGTAVHLDWEVKASFYVSLALIKSSDAFCSLYLTQYINSHAFQRELWRKIIHVAFPKKINLGEIGKCHVLLPPSCDQEKISRILRVWDQAISVTKKMVSNSQRQKKALAQQLLTGKKRLAVFKKSWEKHRLENLFSRVTTRNTEASTNVVTISAQHGLIRQEDYFNKTVASETLDNYFLLKKGQFAYNKSYSNGYPMGAIKRLNKYEKGVVTTLYICFEVRDETTCNPEFFEHYFESGLLNNGLSKVANEGGRAHGLLNVKPSDFFGLTVYVPEVDEQKAISAVLTTADQEIQTLQAKLACLKDEKKALMQQLLTGKRRVKIDESLQEAPC